MHPILYILGAIILVWILFRRAFPLRLPSKGFQFVHVENDGTVRELDKEEQDYLVEVFHPNDGARPYIKMNYWEKTPDGKLHGFLQRNRVPWWLKIKRNELRKNISSETTSVHSKTAVNLGDLIIKFNDIPVSKLIVDWTWLIGIDKIPIMVSAIGDMFLQDNDKKIYWLDVGGGTLAQVAEGIDDFEEKLKNIELVNKWFMIDLTTQLRSSNKKLTECEVYSYNKLPIIGGDYSIDNFEPTDIEVHFSFAGQIHKQIRDLPDGTKIKIKFEGQ